MSIIPAEMIAEMVNVLIKGKFYFAVKGTAYLVPFFVYYYFYYFRYSAE